MGSIKTSEKMVRGDAGLSLDWDHEFKEEQRQQTSEGL